MRKIFCMAIALFLTTLSATSFAAGDYDGIWETSVGEYASITQNGDSVVAVRLIPNDFEWEAFQGDLVENSVTMTTVVSQVTATIRLDFTSTTTGNVTVVACAPTSECMFPVGFQFTSVKIF